jgi:sugar lactone lactonase YvrE
LLTAFIGLHFFAKRILLSLLKKSMKSFLLAIFLFLFSSNVNAQLVTTFAGGNYGYVDGVPTAAAFRDIFGICVNTSGTIYVVDAGNHRIRRITAQGEVSTFAGSETAGHVDGVGTAAQFDYIRGICVDAAGTLYITEYYRIRKITPDGVVTTLAGGDNQGYIDGEGSAAQFFGLMGICVDAAGTLYVADSGNNRIRKVTPAGVVSTLANGTSIFSSIHDLCINNDTGTLYVTDRYGQKIYQVSPAGAISVFAGSEMGYQEGVGTGAQFNFPHCICIDSSGNLYVTDNTYLIRKVTQAGLVSTLAGGPGGDVDGIGTAARFGNLEGICVNLQGIVYVVDIQHNKIKQITPNSLNVYESSQQVRMKLYPNPAKELLNVELNSFCEDNQIILSDLSGKTVYSATITAFITEIDISCFLKGVYLATMQNGSKKITQKIIVE